MPQFTIHPKAVGSADKVTLETCHVANVLTAIFHTVESREAVESTHIVLAGDQVLIFDSGAYVTFPKEISGSIPVTDTVEEVKRVLGL